MKEYFDKINRIILDTENYKIFFENPHEKGHGPDFEQLGEIFFGFTFMKLLDLTLKNTKIEVLEKYEKNKDSDNLHEILLKTATYSDGEIIGFYNTSKYDLTSICLSKSKEELLQYRVLDFYTITPSY